MSEDTEPFDPRNPKISKAALDVLVQASNSLGAETLWRAMFCMVLIQARDNGIDRDEMLGAVADGWAGLEAKP